MIRAVPNSESNKPPPLRDCLACGQKDGLKLHNIAAAPPVNIPLLYICGHCGAQLTIPPPQPPIEKPQAD